MPIDPSIPKDNDLISTFPAAIREARQIVADYEAGSIPIPGSVVTVVPSGSIEATTAQAAIEELDAKKTGVAHDHSGGDGAQIAYSSLSGLPDIPSVSGLLDETAHDLLDHTGLPGIPAAYSLPTASTTVLGGVKVDGTSITITDGVVSAAGAGTGDVVGPASAANNNVAVFDGITGKLLKDGGAALHDPVTVADSTSIGLTLTGQQISAAAIFGTASGTVCQGNDSRLSDIRTPTSHDNTAHSETYITSTALTGLLNETAHDLLDHTGLAGIPTQYTDEMAQDAVGAAIASGTQTGITVSYDDVSNKIDFTVTTSGGGDVTGPASATDGNIPLFDGITGKAIKNSAYNPASFASALGADDNYVTGAEKVKLANLSGTNTGDQDLSTLATKTEVTTGLATKQATLVSGTNIKTLNGASVLGNGDLVVGHTIQDGGVALAARTNLDFVGTAVTVTDDLANDKTIVTVNASGVTDGDKGDITVSGSGATWTVDSVAGNLDFLCTAARIRGDFSNATTANRTMFQTSTTDGNTGIGLLPNGTSSITSMSLYNSSDPGNASNLYFYNSAATSIIRTDKAGSGSYLPLGFWVSGSERMRIDTSGNVTVVSPAGLGYSTGAGGTVTQATSKSTAVTLNKPCGQITMNNAALAAGAGVQFTLNNSLISALDTVIPTLNYNGNYTTYIVSVAAGAAAIVLKNISGGSLSDAVTINFAIIKGANS